MPKKAGPKNENKSQKFSRLANMRVPSVLKKMRSVRNLANRNAYDYSPAQTDAIVRALQDEVNAIKNAFDESKNDEISFKV